MWSTMLLPIVFLVFLRVKLGGANGNCEATNYRSVQNAPEDALVYGITQDCQMFFLRPSQLHLLSSIHVDKRHSFCYANLVQLHVKSHDALLLTFKQASNRICTLEVHIPSMNMLFGDHLFRYSLLNSLPYASCSHSKDQSFQLEPDLSFMDPVYNDVIYFVDALSYGSKWKVIQFLLKDTGSMSMMNNLTVSLQNREATANEFVMSLDNQRDKLYRRNRFDNLIYQQCAFDSMFRPKESELNTFETPSRGYGAILNGQSVDGDVMVYVETDRSTDPPTTRLNMLSTNNPEHVACISATTFSFDVGIIRESTVQRLKNDPRSPFGTNVTPRPKPKDPITNQKISSKPPPRKPPSTTTSAPPSLTSPPTSSATSPKPKGAYSPSKSFFSYETGSFATTTSPSEAVMSNEIPVEQIEKEQDEEEAEEFNEIIKELKSDEDDDRADRAKGVGELRTRIREVNMTSGGGGDVTDHSNDTSSDPEAVKSSGHFQIQIVFSAILIYLFT